MVDLPDRATPRFPADQVPRVTSEARAALDAWDVGPHTTIVCGGARGADLIVAEQAQARGARIVLCLALPLEQFRQRSVDIPNTDWAARFDRLAQVAGIRVLDAPDPAQGGVFEAANTWIVRLARSLDPSPHVIIVWDGRRDGGGAGGTGDMIRQLDLHGPSLRVRVIDPTPAPTRPVRTCPGRSGCCRWTAAGCAAC